MPLACPYQRQPWLGALGVGCLECPRRGPGAGPLPTDPWPQPGPSRLPAGILWALTAVSTVPFSPLDLNPGGADSQGTHPWASSAKALTTCILLARVRQGLTNFHLEEAQDEHHTRGFRPPTLPSSAKPNRTRCAGGYMYKAASPPSGQERKVLAQL